jgi:VWFA-related protein
VTGARLLAAILASALVSASIPAAPENEKPQDVGLMERTSARLAQLDVTVSGPRSAIVGLTAADFEVKLNDRLVPNVIVDALCGTPPSTIAEAPATSMAPVADNVPPPLSPPAAPPAKSAPVTYLIYFDHPHLTQAGRRSSIDAAREMLPKLMAGGNRAMLISNAKDLRTLVPLTTEEPKLDAALAAMIDDNRDFDPYAATEESRMAEVVTEIGKGELDKAVRLARRYAQEERSRQERDLGRLRIVLGRLADLDPPKAVLYFADTMRQNAGEHYMSFFSAAVTEDRNGTPTSDAGEAQLAGSTGGLVLDRVVNEAAAYGIRFYTVEGQGLSGPTTLIQSGNSPFTTVSGRGGTPPNQATPQYNTQHTKDSQGTLVAMALETGGRAFLNGVQPAKMAAQILDDLSCVYLLSFDPRGFPEDKPLAVSVKVARAKVKTSVRGRLVIQGDSARLTSRLLSAYAAPSAKETTVALHVGLIPVGYKDGRYQARVQVSVPPSSIPGTTWDLGASVVTRGTVGQEGSGRISLANPGVPVAWEKDMEFAPGDYDLIAVGHEATTDELTSKEVRGTWPNLDDAVATVGPIAVSQPSKGGFLRDGTSHTSGAVVLDESDPVRADSPTAVITLVCRAKDQKRTLTVVRTLIGDSETPVGKTAVDMGDDRCAQILDFIRPKTLGAGSYRFVVSVVRGGDELAHGERKLFVPEAPQASR